MYRELLVILILAYGARAGPVRVDDLDPDCNKAQPLSALEHFGKDEARRIGLTEDGPQDESGETRRLYQPLSSFHSQIALRWQALKPEEKLVYKEKEWSDKSRYRDELDQCEATRTRVPFWRKINQAFIRAKEYVQLQFNKMKIQILRKWDKLSE